MRRAGRTIGRHSRALVALCVSNTAIPRSRIDASESLRNLERLPIESVTWYSRRHGAQMEDARPFLLPLRARARNAARVRNAVPKIDGRTASRIPEGRPRNSTHRRPRRTGDRMSFPRGIVARGIGPAAPTTYPRNVCADSAVADTVSARASLGAVGSRLRAPDRVPAADARHVADVETDRGEQQLKANDHRQRRQHDHPGWRGSRRERIQPMVAAVQRAEGRAAAIPPAIRPSRH